MVEGTLYLDSIFMSLADPTRRSILTRLMGGALTVNEIARPYEISLAAISKHLRVLENAKLITKHRAGKEQHVELSPVTLQSASKYLQEYEKMWNDRFDLLDNILKES